ncbi:ThuA domain-containing protein [Amnibacterium flavum]|uniref:ThuA domain-containing protein n=1 Tax=Amnibacterium flavum TaxID=2173173 RepID=UPI0023E7D06E|nr:ThuA domain-containing protein [Amnibacterium flavum]
MWNEGVHDTHPEMLERYPDGMHGAIAAGLAEHLPDAEIRTATLADAEQGLPDSLLESTDVLLWWGHVAHDQVDDALVERVKQRVLAGMGLLVLHSGHFSKIFISLMGTTCSLVWRNAGEREVVWTVAPGHPIAEGVPQPIVIEQQEMYGEHFDIPTPDELVFISSFAGGEVFRSGVTYRRGRGRVFYFSPGDEAYPVYHHPDVRRVLANAARWAMPPAVQSLPGVTNPESGWYLP